MRISENIIGFNVRVIRDLMLHFRNYLVSEETTQQFFDTLLWREVIDAAIKLDSRIPRSLRSESNNKSRKEYARIWNISFKTKPKHETKAVLAALLSDGWIEFNLVHDNALNRSKYVLTDKGSQLSVKRLGPRINRAKADKVFKDMIKRIEEINGDPSLLDYVTTLIAFGSYITNSDDLGDIDLYVKLKRRIENNEEHSKACKAFNEASGKQFSSFLDELFYHETAIMQRIKNRSPYISLHPKTDLELADATKVLYEFSPVQGQSSSA